MQVSGLTAGYGPQAPQTPSVGLEAQLTRLQKELSACVNCASANTSEGKKKIQDVADKIQQVKSRMDTLAVQAKRNNGIDASAKISDAQPTPNVLADAANFPETQDVIGRNISIRA